MSLKATVNYHIKSNRTQAFLFDVDGKIGNIVAPDLISAEVTVKDLRECDSAVNFHDDGISFVDAPARIKDYSHSSNWIETYNQEITALLKHAIGAIDVIVFDHTVRIDEPNALRKPARNVHNDYSKEGAEKRLVDLLGEQRAKVFQSGKFGFVNIWRPIEATIQSSPLGFIKPSSMSPEDCMPIELIYPHRIGQILGVSQNDNHEWFYRSKMTPDEAIIFNIYDNTGRPYLAHSALDMGSIQHPDVPRKSIESRTLVCYE